MKVGDYVRTKTGRLGKISNENVDYSSELISVEESCIPIAKRHITKASHKIIDLIEVGDYVNGMEVKRICFDEDGERILNLSNCTLELMNEDVKSILTKEQFESMEYKVGE